MILSLYFWPTVDIDHKTSYIFPTTKNQKRGGVTILVSETYEFINVMHISIEGLLSMNKVFHTSCHTTSDNDSFFLSDYVSCSTLKDKLIQIVEGDLHTEETFNCGLTLNKEFVD